MPAAGYHDLEYFPSYIGNIQQFIHVIFFDSTDVRAIETDPIATQNNLSGILIQIKFFSFKTIWGNGHLILGEVFFFFLVPKFCRKICFDLKYEKN